MKIQIYGQKRTGTNLVQYLLQQSGHQVFVNELNWKHGDVRPDIFDHVDYVVTCHRNPAAWLVSNRKHDAKIVWKEERWVTLPEWAERENHLLKAQYEWGREGLDDRFLGLDTMGLITMSSLTLSFLKDHDLVSELVQIPSGRMDMGGGVVLGSTFDVEYYQRQKYLDELNNQDWAEIGQVLRKYPLLKKLWGTWFTQVARL